jgi:translation initiation factor 3 subunit K
MALLNFGSPDFSLCVSLLPPHVLQKSSSTSQNPTVGEPPLSEAVQKLNILNSLLEQANYPSFWSTFESEDLYMDLTADVDGFEDSLRLRILLTVGQTFREVQKSVLESYLNAKGKAFESLLGMVGFKADGDMIKIPLNKTNEAKATHVVETVKFDQFSRVIRRAYEAPA